MTIDKIIKKYFDKGNVCVTGERGAGKDMFFANTVARRRLGYISNVEYKRKAKLQPEYYPLDFEKLNCGENTYKNFMSGKINYYEYPYPKGVDIYISDVGVYMPSQFCNELNKEYKPIPTFMALSRQLGHCNVHLNVQNLNRAWDKLREQSRTYITCLICKVVPIGKKHELVIQKIRISEKYESCLNNVPKLHLPWYMKFGKDRLMAYLYELNYRIQHGQIDEYTLVYFNKSEYNTNIFEEILKNGKKQEKTEKK